MTEECTLERDEPSVFPLETINVSKQRSPYIVFKEYLTGADGLAQWTKCSAQV